MNDGNIEAQMIRLIGNNKNKPISAVALSKYTGLGQDEIISSASCKREYFNMRSGLIQLCSNGVTYYHNLINRTRTNRINPNFLSPLESNACRKYNGEYVIVLNQMENLISRVMTLNHDGPIDVPTPQLSPERQEFSQDILQTFHDLASRFGFIFKPSYFLARDRRGEPIKCHKCKGKISFRNNSLGCSKCKYYICECGRCLCGYVGFVHTGYYLEEGKFPSLPIERRDRRDFVRVVRLVERMTKGKP